MRQKLSGRTLCGQSFIEKELAGESFRGSDIRLCDFSCSNLERADFSGVITGQFYQASLFLGIVAGVIFSVLECFSSPISYFRLLVNFLGGLLIGFALSSLSIGRKSLKDFWYPTKFFTYSISGILTGLFAFEVLYYSFPKAFISDDTSDLIYSVVVTVCMIWLSYVLFRKCSNIIINATGTNFRKAKLTHADFTGALVRNCDFTGANLDHVNWTSALFKRCKFSNNLSNHKVLNLCTYRQAEKEKDFSYTDLSELNLIEVDLKGVNLDTAILNGSNLSNADLRDANLSNAHVIRTNFAGANLSGTCIANWVVSPETDFKDVVCTHVFIDIDRKERKPASGYFRQGDFAKLITQSKSTLDFLFRNGIDPQAFDFALQQLKIQYPEVDISIRAIENLGDNVQQIKLNKSNNAPTEEMHALGSKAYEEMHQKLEDARLLIWELQQKLDQIDLEKKVERHELEKQLAELQGQLKERPTIPDIVNMINNIRTTQTNYYQYGQGDNIARDKVDGDKFE